MMIRRTKSDWSWWFLLSLYLTVWASQSPVHAEDRKEVKFVETVGVLQAPKEKGQNYTIKTDGGDVFLCAFDDMHKGWPDLKKALPDWVGKRVIVEHREGFVEFGNVKALLARTARLKEEKK
jgi:hypothetical protein